ncbi:MAG TPA: DUF4136 domain-containing protein [Methylomirabilota bacterium]|nr:DUF4136 domain-containing protein [Methylomirabilota bacterium]
MTREGTGLPRAAAVRLMGLSAAVAALIAGCASAPQFRTDFDPRADFAAYRTFAWMPAPAGGYADLLAIPSVRERVERAVGARLKERGLTPMPSGGNPDLIVRYFVTVQERERIAPAPAAAGPYPSTWTGPWTGISREALVYSSRAGTLIVELVDARDRRVVWRAAIEGEGLSDEDVAQVVGAGLEEAFKKYPPSAEDRDQALRRFRRTEGAQPAPEKK